jgi:hypothetical protein
MPLPMTTDVKQSEQKRQSCESHVANIINDSKHSTNYMPLYLHISCGESTFGVRIKIVRDLPVVYEVLSLGLQTYYVKHEMDVAASLIATTMMFREWDEEHPVFITGHFGHGGASIAPLIAPTIHQLTAGALTDHICIAMKFMSYVTKSPER